MSSKYLSVMRYKYNKKKTEIGPWVIRCLGIMLWLTPLGKLAANPTIIALNVSESREVTLSSGKSINLKLLSYEERTEPFYQSRDNSFIEAVVSAEVTVEVDGVKQTFLGGPFSMPVNINGVAVLLACTKGWTGGKFKDKLKKDVRLEVNDANVPWVTPNGFTYPIQNYRWRASNYQHTYLGVVVNQDKLYYHRGEDMGMIPNLEKTLSMNKGVLTALPPPEGDERSNSVSVRDGSGNSIRYAHMVAKNIGPGLHIGDTVQKGQKLGLTGNYYLGHLSPSPHLHVAMRDEKGTYRHTFPVFVEAYRYSFPTDLLPVAGNVRHLYAGEEIELNGTFSLAGTDARIASYKWIFTDGTQSNSPKVRRQYTLPGVYSEELQVTDNKGRMDRDFVEVNVLSRDQSMRPPRAWINYYPIRNIEPGTPVQFLIRYINLRDVTIDYGDGTQRPYAKNTTHSYSTPGNYLITVKGEDKGAGPGVFHVRVIVEE